MKNFDEYIRKNYHYSPTTGLLWRHTKSNSRVVGTPHKISGALRVCILGKVFHIHRVIWFLQYGLWPNEEIDHINGLRGDNRLSNLRLATRQENSYNKPIYKNNKSGIKGIYYHRGRWSAQIGFQKKKIWIGDFDSIEEAKSAYDAKAKELFGEFNRYG